MKQYPGYTLVKQEDCPEQHGTLTVLTHDVSGASVLLVENDDNNKAFGIGFGTFPSDDTGVFHILEHSVLAGSEKYPVKSPFLQLLKSSMASFLNAMTFPDKTVYPFATPNETDFKNLMDVYLNAVFCPLAMVDKAVFEQEGWHRGEDGTVSGVVYNEMQGALASPEYAEANDLEWSDGQTLTAAIGQSYNLFTPLQLANLAAIVANRGYYYIPHIVKKIEGQDSLDRRFYERHYTKVDPKHFEPIVDGMWRGVNVGGTSTAARLEGLDVCGKTGTAENPRGRDHSTFLSFAPKDNPKIAISVYVENGGFGASAALPIASLLEEYYLTDTIRRPELLQYIKDMNIYYPAYDK